MSAEFSQSRLRSPLFWAITLSAIGFFVTVVFGAMVITRVGHCRSAIMVAPLLRDQVVEGLPSPAFATRPGENLLNGSSADHVINADNQTTLTKTFSLADGAVFSLKNINGSVTIGSWDQPIAEVSMIKRGSDRDGQVFYSRSGADVSIRAAPGRANQDITFEVKLPREMGSIEISVINGSIKLSDVNGRIVAEAQNGSIELAGVSGQTTAKTANGKITSFLERAGDGPIELSSVNGSIDLAVNSDFDSVLDASTVHGSINIDDLFGVRVLKEIVGQHARGQIGSGGSPLKLSTVNGSIKLSARPSEMVRVEPANGIKVSKK